MPTYQTFISSFQKGQFKDFDQFYHLTSKQVFFTLKKYIQDAMLIEDFMQDVYMKFIDKIQDVDSSKNVKSYLTTIARNLAIDYLRKQKHVTLDDIKVYQAFDASQVEKDYMWLLEHLDLTEKEIVYLHVIEDLKFKDIAVIVDKPVGTVLWKYQEARKKMKELIKDAV
ncbi:MAG: RNA polymerase sigma factor [Acholeplasmataceae bacterium]